MATEITKVFHSHAGSGFSRQVLDDPACFKVKKRAHQVAVRFATEALWVETLEGRVRAGAGDALVLGVAGESWPVERSRFLGRYVPVVPTVMGEDGLYSTEPAEYLALRMSQSFFVVLPDGVSRLTGSSGDWLLDYGDGSLGIVAASIFENTYDLV